MTAICLIFEGLREGSQLLEGLDAARRAGVPIVALKAGTSDAGAVAAISHTASIVGDDQACLAALKQRDVLVVDGEDQLLEAASFLGKMVGRRPRSKSVMIVTGSGGAGVLACDAAEQYGVPLASLSDHIIDALCRILPPFAHAANPMDVTAGLSGPGGLGSVVDLIATDEAVGVVVVPLGTSLNDEVGSERAADIIEIAERSGVPTAVIWLGQAFAGPSLELLERSTSVGVFRSAALCMRTLKHWLDTFEVEDHELGVDDDLCWDQVDEILARATGGMLDEPTSLRVLSILGLEVAQSSVCRDLKELGEVASTWTRFPAVVKVVSSTIAHKATVGGVKVGLTSAATVVEAGGEILKSVNELSNGRVDGLLLEEQLYGTREIILGAYRDALYGPVVVIGQGGAGAGRRSSAKVIAASTSFHGMSGALDDVPLVADFSNEMKSLLALALTRLGQLMVHRPNVIEVEINPLVASEARLTAVDGLVRLQG